MRPARDEAAGGPPSAYREGPALGLAGAPREPSRAIVGLCLFACACALLRLVGGVLTPEPDGADLGIAALGLALGVAVAWGELTRR